MSRRYSIGKRKQRDSKPTGPTARELKYHKASGHPHLIAGGSLAILETMLPKSKCTDSP